MDNIKVKDLTDTTTVALDNQIMVLTNDERNQVQNVTVANLLSNILSSDNGNVLEQGTDGKLYVETPENITGDLADLETIEKTSLVAATNELNENIGDLSDLSTTSKNNLVGAINEVEGNTQAIIYEALSASKGWLESGKLYSKNYWYGEKIYNDVFYYAHSTFDVSKFTVVGSPAITDDGIASGFSSSNLLRTSSVDFSIPWEITSAFTFVSSTDGQMLWKIYAGGGGWFDYIYINQNTPQLLFTFKTSDDTQYSLRFNYTLINGKDYLYKVGWTGTQYYTKLYDEQNNLIEEKTVNSNLTLVGTTGYVQLGFGSTGLYVFKGSIDLKQFSIKVDGAEVFSGNQTGTDTYTIGGSTVIIPYTLSKTDSKIVDSIYRTQVSSVYSELGYAPYYTIDEENENVTLPMGEIYGLIEQAKEIFPVPAYGQQGIGITIGAAPQTYTAPDDGFVYSGCITLLPLDSFLLYISRDGQESVLIDIQTPSSGTGYGTEAVQFPFFFPVLKGDVVGTDLSLGTPRALPEMYFVPKGGV